MKDVLEKKRLAQKTIRQKPQDVHLTHLQKEEKEVDFSQGSVAAIRR